MKLMTENSMSGRDGQITGRENSFTGAENVVS